MTFTLINRNRLRVILASVAVCGGVGCGDKPGSDDGTDGSATGTGTTSAGTDAPTTGSTTMSTVPSTGDDASGSSGTPGSSGETSSGETGTDSGESTQGSSTDSTTGGGVCALDPCGFAGQLGGDFEDCGTVNPWDDDASAWLVAHNCAVTAAMEQRAFCLVTILQGIDSDVGQAYAAQAARSYAILTQFSDSDPCGGGGCGPVVHESSCAGLTAIENCEVVPGQACLSCDGAGESVQICGPE